MYYKKTLKNGLRLIMVPDKNSQSVTALTMVGAGSKYETKKENGISHFLEHMFFKGTKKRPNKNEIAEDLDKIGGMYNAFTSKEYTGYWAKVRKDKIDLAVDWTADIFLNSLIPAREVSKERGVIIEEYNMYMDMPQIFAEDVWEKLLYGNQPAGWPIIGTKENIKRFKRKDFLDYMNNHYSPSNTVVCVSGAFNKEKIKKEIKKIYGGEAKRKTRSKEKVIEKQSAPASSVFYKKTDQTHLRLGARGVSLSDEKKFAQQILSTILGGNMSSRLFISVREKNGLAYYVRASSEHFTDSGYLIVSAGVPHNKIEKTIGLVLKEFRDIKRNGVSAKELKKAKEYLKGTATLSLESSHQKAGFYAAQELLRGKVLTPKQKFAKIDAVSAKDIKNLAKEIFVPQKINLALVGPHRDKKFESLLKV